MSIVSMIKGRSGASGFGYASTAEEVTAGLDLHGKTILITGVNSGLGAESARVLAMRGARVLGAARTKDKAAEACRALGNDAVPLACELSEPASVRACVAEVQSLGIPVDVLLCNAGIMALPKREVLHGQELQFLTNHIGHFILVTGLLDALAPKGRVVMLSSSAHHRAPAVGIDFDDITLAKSYSAWSAYGQSKLANLLFAKSLAKRLAGTGKTANAVHPGVIATNLARHMSLVERVGFPILAAIALKNVHEGSATQCYVATHPSLESVSGEFFADCNIQKPSRHARNEAMAER
ncbi:MAG: SDR family NAD(P)-dependent oxidoreductase, partial [Myxococcales bacterium]|nr:SDR family NAD(P)-dependent oxidoreductase [Myxococcales bacterium]